MRELEELYVYDESSPTCLRWAVDIYSGRYKNFKNVSVGDVAGGLGNSGYYQVRRDCRLTLVHRVVWELHNGPIKHGLFLDHIDGDRKNNKIGNLRVASRTDNARNCKQRKDNDSGVTGVTLLNNKLRSGNIAQLWRAFWVELDGTKKTKAFNVNKYGYDVAFRLACEHRALQIERLNAEGAGFTERHGT